MTEISVDFKTFSVKIAVNLPTFRSVFLAGELDQTLHINKDPMHQ